MNIQDYETKLNVEFFDHQLEALRGAEQASWDGRICLYFPTGKGKTLTSLVAIALMGATEALVIAPPSTHDSWHEAAKKVGLRIQLVSHAKFRRKDFLVSRKTAVVCDEFHELGGHGGQGWKKFALLSKHLRAPLVIASATPNYNDAERVFCIQHVLDPLSTRGGYIQWLYTHCTTEADRFSMTPKVTGFHKFKDAEEFLASLPQVYYIPDTVKYKIEERFFVKADLPDFDDYGMDYRARRVMASGMERRHARINLELIDEFGQFNHMDALVKELQQLEHGVLIFAVHATVAEALGKSLADRGYEFAVLTGSVSKKEKLAILDQFRAGNIDILVGTATLATGTDGLDKVSDSLVIVDDTDDDSKRRQLIGRILPRGTSTNAAAKRIIRFTLV